VHDDAHDLIIEIVSNFQIVHAALINTTAHSFRSSHSIAVFRETIATEQIVLMPSDGLPKFSRRGSTSAHRHAFRPRCGIKMSLQAFVVQRQKRKGFRWFFVARVNETMLSRMYRLQSKYFLNRREVLQLKTGRFDVSIHQWNHRMR
jgi:hypothetical protein